MNQLQLFDLPPAPVKPARPAPAPPVVRCRDCGTDMSSAPPGVRATRQCTSCAVAADTRHRQATWEAEQARRADETRAAQIARYRDEQAARPGPALDAATLARLSAQGVTVVASYLARDGDASGAGVALYALQGRFTPNGQATILTKTRDGVQALLVTMEGRANAVDA